jgi:hypothetical protein
MRSDEKSNTGRTPRPQQASKPATVVLEANREAVAVVSTGFGRVFLITVSRNLLLTYLPVFVCLGGGTVYQYNGEQ